MANSIIMGYSPNDFFYSQAGSLMPTDDQCLLLTPDTNTNGEKWDDLCDDAHFIDNSGNCISRQLCINKQNVDSIVKNENAHLESQKRNADMNVLYNRTIMDSVNLGIGILFILFVIYRNRNIS